MHGLVQATFVEQNYMHDPFILTFQPKNRTSYNPKTNENHIPKNSLWHTKRYPFFLQKTFWILPSLTYF
ncbi:hypothetical protein QNI22_14530 [Cytophagaceae bacterium BD1B2-1]|uniref:Uncharacterized protein n=1 Tax=Xanthocytophaga agilis TaxID=3048010 RepID=A0AAE3R5Q0_9BACT|nr:hypothetical protein [Xanthocytophaga agilis]